MIKLHCIWSFTKQKIEKGKKARNVSRLESAFNENLITIWRALMFRKHFQGSLAIRRQTAAFFVI